MTKQTDYGIVLLTHVAKDSVPSIHTARDLATEANIPLPMVSKVLKALARSGLLVSHRGVKGGFTLARRPEEITVSEIIHALEGPIALTECLGEAPSDCQIELLCPTRTNWWKINEAVRNALAAITLADMVQPMTASFVSFSNPVRDLAPEVGTDRTVLLK